jgi:hypothetical protein
MLRTVFYDTALTQTTTPLNRNVSDDTLRDAADDIAQLFLLRMARPEPVYPEIQLTFGQSELSDDTVVTPDTRAIGLFGIADGEWKWGQFIQELDLKDSPLVGELDRAIKVIARRRAPGPVAANYRSPETGTYYTPAIYRVERLNGKLVTCRVALIPQSTPIDTGGPGDEGLLFNMLKMGARFRWEIVETFLSKLRAVEPGFPTMVYIYLKNAIEVIEREGAAFHFDDYENVKNIFAPTRRNEILSLYDEWKLLRAELDEDIEAKDAEKVTTVLQKIRHLNQTFMAIASVQYAEDLALN